MNLPFSIMKGIIMDFKVWSDGYKNSWTVNGHVDLEAFEKAFIKEYPHMNGSASKARHAWCRVVPVHPLSDMGKEGFKSVFQETSVPADGKPKRGVFAVTICDESDEAEEILVRIPENCSECGFCLVVENNGNSMELLKKFRRITKFAVVEGKTKFVPSEAWYCSKASFADDPDILPNLTGAPPENCPFRLLQKKEAKKP